MTTASAHVPTAPHYATFEVDQETRLVDGSVVANGEFEIVHELGRGGMSVVYRAVDRRSGTDVALKVANASSSTLTTTRFDNEARLGERLREHPNVVVASRVGQLDEPEEFAGRAYLVMDFVEGTSLADVMADHRIGLPWERACTIALDVAIALEALHGVGVVHRDIKPANVLLAADKSVLIDFGLAYSTGDGWTEPSPSLTQEGSAPGTLLYMSPEQVGHAKPAPSMDTYSFGVMLYELFTGNPPYHRLSQAEMVARKCDPSQTPYPLAKICPELDSRLATLVHRCLRHAPVDRPTATELREGLAQALDARAAVVLPTVEPSQVVPPPIPTSRPRLPLGVLTLGVLGALALVLWLWPRESKEIVSAERTSEPTPVASHMTTQSAEPPAVGTPWGEHPQQPPASEPEPADTKLEAPHATPNEAEDPPDKEIANQRPEDPCSDRIKAARRSKSESQWGTVLRLTRKTQCWKGATKNERKKLRTRALFETEKYAECAAAGRGLTDPDTVRWVRICESKANKAVPR